LLAAACVGVVATTATVVTAAYASYTCPADNICFYQHKDYGGRILALPAVGIIGFPTLHTFACPGCRSSEHSGSNDTWGDQMSSWTNNSTVAICAYQHINYGGSMLMMPAGGSVALVASNWNDQVSSFKPCFSL